MQRIAPHTHIHIKARHLQTNAQVVFTGDDVVEQAREAIKKAHKMELPWLFMQKGMKINSQKLQLLKRLLKIIKQLPKTFLENQKI